jgi:hypothetical protein
MEVGYQFQTGEWDSEILRSSDFQTISITVDATSEYDPSAASGDTKLPKGLLMTLSTDLADGTYEPLSTAAGELGTKQDMKDVVVLAETIKDASLGDQPVKAYWAGTFDYRKLKWNNSDNDGLTQAEQEVILGRIKIVDTVFQT